MHAWVHLDTLHVTVSFCRDTGSQCQGSGPVFPEPAFPPSSFSPLDRAHARLIPSPPTTRRNVLGYIYPAYLSYKSLNSRKNDQIKEWCIYW